MFDELDGRDPAVRQHFRNRKDMVTSVQKPEKQLADYSDPWGPAFYSRFDDLPPVREAEYQAFIQGEPGCRRWSLPATAVEHHFGAAAWYDQLDMGNVVITEVPLADGTTEFWIKIVQKD